MEISFNDQWQDFPSLLVSDEISNPINTILECANTDNLFNVREHMNDLLQCAILSDRFQKLPMPLQENIVDTYNAIMKLTDAAFVLKQYSLKDELSYCVGGIRFSP